jgi:hypothetical protein
VTQTLTFGYAEELVDAPERKAMQDRFQDVYFRRWFLEVSGHKALLLHRLEARHTEALGKTARLASLKEATDKARNYIDDPDHQAWARENGIALGPTERERQIAGFEQMVATLHNLQKRMPDRVEAPKPTVSCKLEQYGFDVIMRAAIRYPWESDLKKNYLYSSDDGCAVTIAIKIQWTVGDNYLARVRSVRWRAGTAVDHIVLLVGRFNGRSTTKEQFVKEWAAAGVKVVFAADLEVRNVW